MTLLTEPTRIVLAKGQPVPNDPNFALNSLLLHGNGTNGSTVITDSSGSPKAITVGGNAQISTAIADPFGSSTRGVMAFDGNNDYLLIPQNEAFVFGVGNFTIEFWAWKSSDGAVGYDYPIASDINGNATNGFGVELSSLRGFVFLSDSSIRAQYNFNPNTSSWKHYAVTRSGNSLRLFVDGVQQAINTGFSAALRADNAVTVGSATANLPSPSSDFNGYIDDLRITKGVARYTSNFTPPTLPFPDF